MQSINTSNYAYNSFDFSLTTSSGDKINLKLFDKKSSELDLKKRENSQTLNLSLRHTYGYEFSYKGDGIDEQDKKEIAEALKKVQPMLEKYLENVKQSQKEIPLPKIINNAFEINQHLPKPKDLSTKSYIQDKLLDNFDELLKKTKDANEKLLEQTKKLFDALSYQMDRFEFYI